MTKVKAQVGDLIRVTDAVFGKSHYKNVDILTVKQRGTAHDHGVFTEEQPIYLYDYEYEIYRKQAHPAQVGDLIRITTIRDEITAYKLGGIYEVTSLEASNYDQIVINGELGQSGYVFADEYVVHRKAGEEDSEVFTQVDGYEIKGGKIVKVGEQDAVNPQHYKQGRVEVIDIIEDAVQGADPFEAVCQANILKYTLRYRHKNGVTDLRKAVWYTEKLIAHLDAKSTQE